MEFKEFRAAVQKQFNQMQKDAEKLFVVNVDKDELWKTYMDAFPEGTNPIFRKQREFECSCCRGFIKNIGNVVAIKNGVMSSIWDIELNITDGDTKFQVVADAMSAFVKAHAVADIYISKERKIGQEYNFEENPDGTPIRWEHFQIVLPDKYVNSSRRDSNETIKGQFRDVRNVFKRSLDEFSLDSVLTVLELIADNNLYKGEEWKRALTEFKKYKAEYDTIADEKLRELYAWEKSIQAGVVVGKIRNSSMGTLLIDLNKGMELDEAVRRYEVVTAPNNYKRPKAIFTKKMLEDAKQTITEMGYMPSLSRRFAKLDDVSVNDILFADRSVAPQLQDAEDVFASLGKQVTNTPQKFSGVKEISAAEFIKKVIPGATGLEVYLENKHTGNLVSLIAPTDITAKSMFKWGNNFSWAYAGNVTDSMKERVKAAGGRVDGDLRFSIQWNETDEDNCDMDAHCKEPNGNEIYYSRKRSAATKGELDVDIINPEHKVAVENITWADRRTMIPGTYVFFVEQFSGNGKRGFRAEIEFDGQIISFDYSKPTRSKERVMVAEVTLDKNGNFTVKELLPSSTSSREVWGLATNQFVPVTLACYSPNYWGTKAEDEELTGVGNRHLFFMLDGCVNEDTPNGMFNEFLKDELMKHKRVFEALGAQCRVKEDPEQLSGLGFSMTKRAEVIVKVKGQTERVMKVMF